MCLLLLVLTCDESGGTLVCQEQGALVVTATLIVWVTSPEVDDALVHMNLDVGRTEPHLHVVPHAQC